MGFFISRISIAGLEARIPPTTGGKAAQDAPRQESEGRLLGGKHDVSTRVTESCPGSQQIKKPRIDDTGLFYLHREYCVWFLFNPHLLPINCNPFNKESEVSL